MAAEQAETHRIAILESLFRDEEKDITFQLADGQECAHKAILKAASEVFAQMLAHDMQEKATRVISLPDVSRKVMRVFLRLVYSGSADESDWVDGEASKKQQGEPEPLVLKQAYMRVQGSRLTSAASSWQSAVLLRGGGVGDFAFSVRAESWQKGHVMLGIAPAGCTLCQDVYNVHGFFGHVDGGTLSTLFAQDGLGGNHLPSALQLPPGAEVTVKFVSGVLHFAVNGGQLVAASFGSPIPMGADYAPAIVLGIMGTTVEVVSSTSALCPLDVLAAVASLAKKYMVASVLSMCTSVLKERTTAAKSRKDVASFEQIMAAAIASDMGGVRMAALTAAEDFAELRRQYEQGGLRPEVMQDLEAIWPPTATQCKRRKLSCLA